MSGNLINRVFLARLAGTAVFDPNGDPVGKVRDALATLRANNQPPRILGLIVEVPLRRRVFVPITRVNSIESGAVVITGLLNMRRFEARTGEVLVLGDMLDRSISLVDSGPKISPGTGFKGDFTPKRSATLTTLLNPASRAMRRATLFSDRAKP